MPQNSSVLGQNNEKNEIWPLTFWPLNDLIDTKIATYDNLTYIYVYVKIDGYSCHIDQIMAQNSSIFGQNSEEINIWPLTFWPQTDLIDTKMATYDDLACMYVYVKIDGYSCHIDQPIAKNISVFGQNSG